MGINKNPTGSEYLEELQEIARELRANNSKLTQQEAIKKASKQLTYAQFKKK